MKRIAGLGVLSAVGLFIAFTILGVSVDVGQVHDLPGHGREAAIEKGLFHIDPPAYILPPVGGKDGQFLLPNKENPQQLEWQYETEWLDCIKWNSRVIGADCLVERGLRSDGVLVGRRLD